MKKFEPYIEKARQGQKKIFHELFHSVAKSLERPMQSKFIPISDESLEDCHYKAGKDLISIYANNHPDNNYFSIKI